MTNDEIEKISQRVADLVIEAMLNNATTVTTDLSFFDEEQEQKLLIDLAKAMTELDYNLQNENYEKCKELQDKIKIIENKLDKFK
tara:strand:+ start:49 stop:303 length:255 start_codon:yes stop_codon:yes gene_type:complete